MSGKSERFTFTVGYHAYNGDQLFNFQLNRWHSLGYARHEEVEAGAVMAGMN